MKNQNGKTSIVLIIIIVLIIGMATILVRYLRGMIVVSKLQDLKTNMLIMQAETKKGLEKVCYQTANLNKENEEDNAKIEQAKAENLIGIKLSDASEDVKESVSCLPQDVEIDDNCYYLDDETLDADEEIKLLQKQIAFFEKEGCSENQDVTTCSINAPSASGFIKPTPYGYITSYYGGRIHPIFGTASYHSGVDIAADTGTEVYASATGKVIFAGNIGDGFGNYIMVAHNANGTTYTTLYGHLSAINTSEGAIVQRGQVIGRVGSTGWSTGPHLHFQMMYGSGYGTTLDPMSMVDLPLSW